MRMNGQVFTVAKLQYVNGVVYFTAREGSTDVTALADHFEETTKSGDESLDNLTPADVYNGRRRQRLPLRDMIKRKTLRARKILNLGKRRRKKQLQLLNTNP